MKTLLIITLLLTIYSSPPKTVQNQSEPLNVNLYSDDTKQVSRGKIEPLDMVVTAYHESECGKSPDHPEYGITFSGEPVREWYTVAAAPMFAIGTVLFIPHFADKPNNGIFVVKDRGKSIVDKFSHPSRPELEGLPCVDVYMSNLDEVEKFGGKRLEVYVLKEGEVN
jgi:3D (Asp-Asp-Asp) domain-containing protein